MDGLGVVHGPREALEGSNLRFLDHLPPLLPRSDGAATITIDRLLGVLGVWL